VHLVFSFLLILPGAAGAKEFNFILAGFITLGEPQDIATAFYVLSASVAVCAVLWCLDELTFFYFLVYHL